MARLDSVLDRLRDHAEAVPSGALTAPDPPTGERWEWGQVWAHLAEFSPYWTDQVRAIVAAHRDDPVPFGRTKTDPERIAAIERDRAEPPALLMQRLEGQVADVRALIEELSPGDWRRAGLHPTLGVMSMPEIVDEFLVGHLEQHARQLDELAAIDLRARPTGDA